MRPHERALCPDSCDDEGFGITFTCWEFEDATTRWREDFEHLKAQYLGREVGYAQMWLRIAKVERARKIGGDPND